MKNFSYFAKTKSFKSIMACKKLCSTDNGFKYYQLPSLELFAIQTRNGKWLFDQDEQCECVFAFRLACILHYHCLPQRLRHLLCE